MYKKLNNKEWEEAINLYYKENNDISIKEYSTTNNLNDTIPEELKLKSSK